MVRLFAGGSLFTSLLDNVQHSSINTVQTTVAKTSTSPAARDVSQENSIHTLVYLDPPEWVHGEPITDRRSTFQAHAAVVQTTDEVQSIRLGYFWACVIP